LLIRRLKVHKHYDACFPNETLKSEFDVTEQIYRTTTTYGIKSTYKWVRGHQDKNTAYDDLELEAQLNVGADKYAGDFQPAKGKFRPLVSLLPSCDARLLIRGISVTSNYRKQLIRAYVEPEYIQYIYSTGRGLGGCCLISEIYNWDGQTHCPRTDCFEA
jgi:hypothetical protein